MDEPVGDPGVVAQFLVNKEISKKFKNFISGQGSDEFFMGYMRNYIFYIKRKYKLDKMSNKSTIALITS